MKKKYLFLILMLVAMGCKGNSSDNECVDSIQKSHSWKNYHWKDLNPTVVDKTRDVIWFGEVQYYVDHWSDLNTPIQPVTSTDRKSAIFIAERNNNDWLGLAQVWIQDGHIVEGKVLLNTTVLKQARFTKFAAHKVLCQELGHIWGLDHNRNDLDTCMNDCVGQAIYNDWLTCINHSTGGETNQHDIEELLAIYDHVHEPSDNNEPDAGNKPKNGPDCNEDLNHPSCKEKNNDDLCSVEGRWVTVHKTPLWKDLVELNNDAGHLDSGVLDAGYLDSGVLDAGYLDSGVLDAGYLDSGVYIDANSD